MGRIKTSDIKKLARKIMKEHTDFKGEFKHDKDILKGINLNKTKRIKNKIAGYITKTTKRTLA